MSVTLSFYVLNTSFKITQGDCDLSHNSEFSHSYGGGGEAQYKLSIVRFI